MIHGLFLDPRIWAIDFKSSPFWHPEKYGCKIDLHNNAFQIPNIGIDKKYKFVICTEVWEIPMRKTLQYLRNKGLKVFLTAREPFKTKVLQDAMFSYKKYFWNNEYFFTPDVVFAAGSAYADLWQDKTEVAVTGYPRFDIYVDKGKWPSKKDIAIKHNLDVAKKWILFPDYPPYHYKKENNNDITIDLFKARENTIIALDNFTKKNPEYQVVIKIHPSSMKPFLKSGGKGKEVAGIILDRYKKPTSNMIVVGDDRQSGNIAKQLLISSDLIVGYTSTMLLEAGMIDKPSIHVLFDNSNIDGIPEYIKYLPTATNESELSDIIINNKMRVVPKSFIEQYLYKVDGNACERICSNILKKINP